MNFANAGQIEHEANRRDLLLPFAGEKRFLPAPSVPAPPPPGAAGPLGLAPRPHRGKLTKFPEEA